MSVVQHVEQEIFEPTLLCDRKGNLNPAAIGYARKPIIQCNLRGNFMRKKRWNCWSIYGDEMMFSATVSHLDYAVLCNVYVFEYETQRYFEKNMILPIGALTKMSKNVYETTSFRTHTTSVLFKYEAGITNLQIMIDNFNEEPLTANLHIEHPHDDDSLNLVIPWNRQTFQFAAKHHTLPTSGTVNIGNRTFLFGRDDSFAVLDYGRGIWPRQASWNWGMASQRIGKRRIGLNFGGKWTDGTGLTENAIFIDGQMQKISEDVQFIYDRTNFMKPWKIESKFTNRVRLTFEPFYERIATSNTPLLKYETHQMFGYYNGRIQLDNGSWLHIPQMIGCVEECMTTW